MIAVINAVRNVSMLIPCCACGLTAPPETPEEDVDDELVDGLVPASVPGENVVDMINNDGGEH
jgi:hypothetical protein